MTEDTVPLDGGPRAGADATEPRRGMLGDSVLLQGDTTLLDYEILPTPNPLQAGAAQAALTLVVSNGRSVPVTCTRIVLTLAVGTNAKALVASAAGITSQAPTGWSVAQSAGAFTLMPVTPAAGQIGALGLSFVFAGLAVNGQVGTTTLTIDERAAMAAQPAVERTGALELPKFPPQFTLSDLTARPLDVQAGGAATLSWSGSPATYRLEFNPGGGGQSVPVGNAGPYVAESLTRYPAVTFTLVVTSAVPGQDQPLVAQKQASVGVNLPPPTVASFGGSAAAGQATLRWEARDADSCSMNALPQLLKPSGSVTVGVDRIRYTVAANASRAGMSSAPSVVDLRMTMTRRQVMGEPGPGPTSGRWLGTGGDGSRLVAMIYFGPTDSVFVVDRASLGVTGTADYGSATPAFALSRDGSRFLVPRGDTLTVLSIPSLTPQEVPWTFGPPLGAAFSPDGATLYVAGTKPMAIHVYDASLVARRSFPIPDIGACATSGDGSRLYVAGGRSLLIIDPATGAVLGSPPIGGTGYGGIVVDAVRNRAYVSGERSGTVSIVDLAAMTTLGQVPVGRAPLGIALGPGGDEIYVANAKSGSISVIDANTLDVITTVPVPDSPVGLAFAPGTPLKLYVLTTASWTQASLCVLEVTS